MYWDTHMHCKFSGDSTTEPEDMILSAVQKGLDGICFTDHIDYDYPGPVSFQFLPKEYFKTLKPLSMKYQNRITVHIGVELGLQPHLKQRYEEFLTKGDFDQVIASSHVVHGFDPYYPEFYKGKTEEEAYHEYFESILENVSIFEDFDVYGHIDYVVRYGPTKNANYTYEKYQDIIDEILIALIAKGKGIELNMAGFKYGLGHPHPTEAVLKRYHELGGEILTLGSDAHAKEHVAYDYNKLYGLLTNAGFSHYTVFQKRKPIFYKITPPPAMQSPS